MWMLRDKLNCDKTCLIKPVFANQTIKDRNITILFSCLWKGILWEGGMFFLLMALPHYQEVWPNWCHQICSNVWCQIFKIYLGYLGKTIDLNVPEYSGSTFKHLNNIWTHLKESSFYYLQIFNLAKQIKLFNNCAIEHIAFCYIKGKEFFGKGGCFSY